MNLIPIKIKRQDSSDSQPYWQMFEVPLTLNLTVLGVLRLLRKKSVTMENKAVAPVVFENHFAPQAPRTPLLVNGKVRIAEKTLVKDLSHPIKIEPLSKFKVLRDLIVDKRRIQEESSSVFSWLSLDGFRPLGALPERRHTNSLAVQLTSCTECGACLEACPQYHDQSAYRGAKVLSQVYRLNDHPNGRALTSKRLMALTDAGGVEDCGNAQNCQKACPMGINLLESLGQVKKQTIQMVWSRFFGDDHSQK